MKTGLLKFNPWVCLACTSMAFQSCGGESTSNVGRTAADDLPSEMEGEDASLSDDMADEAVPATRCIPPCAVLAEEHEVAGRRLECPLDVPDAGASCKGDQGLVCSYGEDIQFDCRSWMRCGEQTWVLLPPLASCVRLEPEHCPGSRPADGASCLLDQTSYGIPCEFEDGGLACFCLSEHGDAREIQPGEMGTWNCLGPPDNSACPIRPPHVGESCGEEGASCDYDIPCVTYKLGYYECVGGAWEQPSRSITCQ